MIGLVVIIIAATVAWSIVRLGLAIVHLYSRKYREYALAANDFYESANRLADNDETPRDVLEMVGLLNDTINDEHTAIAFSRVVYRKRSAIRRAESAIDIHKLPPSVAVDFIVVISRWFDAITARSPYFGFLLRLSMNSKSAGVATTKAARDIQSSRRLIHA